MKSSFLFAILCLCLVSLAGCFRPADPPVLPAVEYENGPNLHFMVAEGEVRISDTGQDLTGEVQMPDDVPLPENATYLLNVDSDAGQFVTVEVAEVLDTVRQQYAEEFSGQGWEITSELATDNSHSFAATKQGRELTVLLDVGGNPSTTKISLSHRPGSGR